MESTSEVIRRNKRLIALNKEQKLLAERQRLLEMLPQGHGSGLNADLLDGYHALEIIEKARKSIVVKAGGSGARGITEHDLLNGLLDDDHTQYYNQARGDARYVNVTGDTMTGDLDLDTNALFLNAFMKLDPAANTTARLYRRDIADWASLEVNELAYKALRALSGIVTIEPKRETSGSYIHFDASQFNGGWSQVECARLANRTGGGADVAQWNISRAGNITFLDTKKLGTSLANDDYFTIEAVDNDTNLLVECARAKGATEPALEVSRAGDITFVNDDGLAIGEIYANNNAVATQLAAQDTWYQVTIFDSDGVENNMDADHTNDHIIANQTGRYLITCHICCYSGASNVYHFKIFTNNGTTGHNNCEAMRSTTVAGKPGSIALSGIIDIVANDTIELWVKRTDGGAVLKTITVGFCSVSATMTGG